MWFWSNSNERILVAGVYVWINSFNLTSSSGQSGGRGKEVLCKHATHLVLLSQNFIFELRIFNERNYLKEWHPSFATYRYIFKAYPFESLQSKGFYGRKKINFFMNNPNSSGLFLKLNTYIHIYWSDSKRRLFPSQKIEYWK